MLVRVFMTLFLLSSVLPGLRPAASETAAQVQEKARPELNIFSFDDHTIPFKKNLKLTLVEAQKYEATRSCRAGRRVPWTIIGPSSTEAS